MCNGILALDRHFFGFEAMVCLLLQTIGNETLTTTLCIKIAGTGKSTIM